MGASKQELRDFVLEYLTEDDLKNDGLDVKNLEEIKKIARYNLRYIGPISWL